MPDNFNDTLDNIKFSLGSAERHFGYGEDHGDPEAADRALHYATTLYNRTAAMNAVFQTEVLLVIADTLTRIADAMEAADSRDDDGEMSIAEAVRIAHDAKIYSR